MAISHAYDLCLYRGNRHAPFARFFGMKNREACPPSTNGQQAGGHPDDNCGDQKAHNPQRPYGDIFVSGLSGSWLARRCEPRFVASCLARHDPSPDAWNLRLSETFPYLGRECALPARCRRGDCPQKGPDIANQPIQGCQCAGAVKSGSRTIRVHDGWFQSYRHGPGPLQARL